MSEFDSILVTTDFSDAALAGVKTADRLAERLGSRLVLVYVVEDRLPPIIGSGGALDAEAILEQHQATAETNLEAYAQEHLPGHQVETAVLRGIPHSAIVAFAEERKAGFIVIASHGHGFLVSVLVGSTTERVIHHAPCPVVVVGSKT